MPDRLVLFDIDATLVTTSRAGIRSMQDAGRELYAREFTIDGVEFAGRLDPLIIDDLLAANGIGVTERSRAELREAYGRHLERRLKVSGTASALPGVHRLIDLLAGEGAVTLGLLTGNFPETGRMKLGACGIEADGFAVRVWGCDSPHDPPARVDLPLVAMERFERMYARSIAAQDVTIVGDTPHDVACAKAHGCRCLAVATGMFDAGELAGADHVVEDLSCTAEISAWLRG
ncbi:MAG: HAD hydrolase-like protein [Planctomycetes bacterium]|nr:HAD hydrolase-like protein [Planctomycetota bacterium]